MQTQPIISKENITLYAILDISNPIVAWEVAIGRICSACDPIKTTYATSIWFYSFLLKLSRDGINQRFLNELYLEEIRLKHFPKAVSRLRGVYFFKNQSDAEVAIDRWGFQKKRPFISAVNFSANELTEVDSEWITSCINSEHRDWMNSYWAGETYGAKPLTEVLASGMGTIQNNDLRSKACAVIYKTWLTATPLLSMAACVFKELKHFPNIGMISPVVMSDGASVRGKHVVNIEALAHEDEVIRALDACKKRGEVLPMVIPDDGDAFFRIPDLSHLQFEFQGVELSTLFGEIHRASQKHTIPDNEP